MLLYDSAGCECCSYHTISNALKDLRQSVGNRNCRTEALIFFRKTEAIQWTQVAATLKVTCAITAAVLSQILGTLSGRTKTAETSLSESLENRDCGNESLFFILSEVRSTTRT